jgi:hypothetical protein
MAPATSIALLATIRKFCNQGKKSVANSIQKSSLRTYSTGVRRVFQFVKEFGTDPFMRTVPREFFQYKREEVSFLAGGVLHGLHRMVTRTPAADKSQFGV